MRTRAARARGTSKGHSRRGAYGHVDHQGDLWLLGPVRQPAQLIAEGCNAIRMFRSRHHDTCGGGGGGAATFLAIPPRSGESAPGWRVQEGRSEVPASCTSADAQVIRANTKSERMFSPLPCLGHSDSSRRISEEEQRSTVTVRTQLVQACHFQLQTPALSHINVIITSSQEKFRKPGEGPGHHRCCPPRWSSSPRRSATLPNAATHAADQHFRFRSCVCTLQPGH